MPRMRLRSVVFPAPLSPTRAVTSPAFAVKSSDDNTWTGPNDFSIPRSSSRGVAVMSCHLLGPAWGGRRRGLDPTVDAGSRRGLDAVGGAQLHERGGRADRRGGHVAVGH